MEDVPEDNKDERKFILSSKPLQIQNAIKLSETGWDLYAECVPEWGVAEATPNEETQTPNANIASY